VLLTLALPHDPDRWVPGIAAPAIAAFGVAGLLLWRFDRLPMRVFHALPFAGTMLVTSVVASGGADTLTAYAMLYFWVAVSAFSFFSVREGMANLALVGVSFAIALSLREDQTVGELGWLMALGTLTVTGLLLAALRHRVDRLSAKLRHRVAAQEVIAEVGKRALAGYEPTDLFDWTVRAVAHTLEVESVGIFKLLPNGRELVLRSGWWWREGMVGSAVVPATDPLLGPALGAHDAVIQERLAADPEGVGLIPEHEIASAVAVRIAAPNARFGVLAACSRAERSYSDEDAHFLQAVANVLSDAIGRRRAEEEMRHQSLHDPLTGRPNRGLFLDRLNEALIRAHAERTRLAVFFVDIDDFKLINDGAGQDAGDELLRAFPSRLRSALVMADTVARLGADEFAVLCEGVRDDRQAIGIAERLLGTLEDPFEIKREHYRVSASIGVALSGVAVESAHDVFAQAEAAMYRAKDRNRGGYEVFDEELRRRMRARLDFENALRAAPRSGELHLAFQPIVRLDDASVRGCEALLRWNHSGLGPVSPLEFIPVAEQTGAIIPIGEWVLDEACRQITWWREEYGDDAPVPLHINVSARELAQADFADRVEKALLDAGIGPGEIAFEVTESALLASADHAASTLERLRGLGALVVLDDFGTGYSSLSHLKAFPLDVVKVDRMFISHLTSEPTDAAIVAAVLGMAEAFDLEVVAEGIETQDVAERLRDMGCRLGQGYHFGRPGSVDEVLPLRGGNGSSRLRPAE